MPSVLSVLYKLLLPKLLLLQLLPKLLLRQLPVESRRRFIFLLFLLAISVLNINKIKVYKKFTDVYMCVCTFLRIDS